jgi:DNA-directed RNA polymerase specialized sigma24 family protein
VPLSEGPARSLEAFGDEQLLSACGGGNAMALGELYDRYAARAHRLARAICVDPWRADRAVESAFAALRGRPALRRPRGGLSTWLLTIVCRYAVEEARGSGQCYDPFRDLPDGEAEVVMLARYGDLSYLEIADHLDIPPSTVKRMMRQALRELGARQELSSTPPEPSDGPL